MNRSILIQWYHTPRSRGARRLDTLAGGVSRNSAPSGTASRRSRPWKRRGARRVPHRVRIPGVIMTSGGTESINLAILGRITRSITPSTKLVVVNHGSNVFGTVQPVAEIARLCREAAVPFLLDAAQTAGVVPIDMARDGIDLVAFAGHKGLYGPAGTGGLVIADGFDHGRISPLKFGGTGAFPIARTSRLFFRTFSKAAPSTRRVSRASRKEYLSSNPAGGPSRPSASTRKIS